MLHNQRLGKLFDLPDSRFPARQSSALALCGMLLLDQNSFTPCLVVTRLSVTIPSYAAGLCVSGGVQSVREPIRCDGRRVLRSLSDRSDPGPTKPWHQEPLCKVAKPSPKKLKMCSTEGAGNQHEVESQRACDAVPKMHGFVLVA